MGQQCDINGDNHDSIIIIIIITLLRWAMIGHGLLVNYFLNGLSLGFLVVQNPDANQESHHFFPMAYLIEGPALGYHLSSLPMGYRRVLKASLFESTKWNFWTSERLGGSSHLMWCIYGLFWLYACYLYSLLNGASKRSATT